MKKKKSTTFKIIITILILLLALIIGLVIFAFAKFHSLNNSIREPLDRDHSQLRQKFKRWRSNDRCVIWY